MRVSSKPSADARIRFVRFLQAAIGYTVSACGLLPEPDITVNTLRSGSITVDSMGVVFALRSGVTSVRDPKLCMILDTLHYVFRPRAEKFHPLRLTDTTVNSRNISIQDAPPIALRAVLEGKKGDRVESSGGEYSPGNGMDTPYNRAHLLGEEGEVVCLGWNSLRPGVTYLKLRLRSTRPIVVHEPTWHYRSSI